MRIAYVTEVWSPTVNGVVTRLQGTIDELLRRGHEVLVVAPRVGPEPADRSAEGLHVRRVPAVGVPFIYGGQPWGLPLPRVAKYLREFQPNLVHVVNPAFLGMAGVAAASRRRVPLVCSYHTDLAAYMSYYHLGFLRPVLWLVLRLLHGRAAVNLVTSAVAARQLQEAGIPRIVPWRRGVDLTRFSPPETAAEPGRPRTALYVGRLAEEKGLGLLAELGRVPGLQLLVVGDGPARQAVRHQLRDLPVEFTGALHGRDLAEAYRRADVFVFPSRTETLGLVLLEALASGLPVVAADSPASREVLGGCAAARLFTAGAPGQLATAVTEALDADRGEVAAAARGTVDGFGWAAATDQLELDYQAALHYRDNRPRHRVRDQLWRFFTVGVSNVVIDLGLFNLLLAMHPTRSPALLVAYNTVAVLAALVNSYWWNSRWTFRHASGCAPWTTRRGLLFAGQGAVNVVVNDLAVAGVSAGLAAASMPAALAGNLAKVAGMLMASLVSFLLMRHVVFHHRGTGRTRTSGGRLPAVEEIERARQLRAARVFRERTDQRRAAGGDR